MRSPTERLGLTLAAVLIVLAFLPLHSFSAPLAEAGAGGEGSAATTPRFDDVGWVSVHNDTGHRITITYRSEHDEHPHHVGRVRASHAKKFSFSQCDRDFSFRAADKRHNHWDRELHVECGHTLIWRVGGHH